MLMELINRLTLYFVIIYVISIKIDAAARNIIHEIMPAFLASRGVSAGPPFSAVLFLASIEEMLKIKSPDMPNSRYGYMSGHEGFALRVTTITAHVKPATNDARTHRIS